MLITDENIDGALLRDLVREHKVISIRNTKRKKEVWHKIAESYAMAKGLETETGGQDFSEASLRMLKNALQKKWHNMVYQARRKEENLVSETKLISRKKITTKLEMKEEAAAAAMMEGVTTSEGGISDPLVRAHVPKPLPSSLLSGAGSDLDTRYRREQHQVRMKIMQAEYEIQLQLLNNEKLAEEYGRREHELRMQKLEAETRAAMAEAEQKEAESTVAKAEAARKEAQAMAASEQEAEKVIVWTEVQGATGDSNVKIVKQAS